MVAIRRRQCALLPILVAVSTAMGCTEPEGVPLSLTLFAEGAYADPSLFRAEIMQGDGRRDVPPAQLSIRARSSTHVDANVDRLWVAVGHPVTVRVAVVSTTGDTAGSAVVSWTPERNWRYGVIATLGTQRFLGFCTIGTQEAVGLPPRGGNDGDSLFVVRSGLPEGAVC